MRFEKLFIRCAGVAMALATVPLMARSGGSGESAAPVFTSAKARAYVAQAYDLAGPDLHDEVSRMCRPQPFRPMVGPPPPPGTVVKPPRPRVERAAFSPNQVFDNMWYFGTSEVGSTVVRTSRGLVLIDAMTTAEDAERVLLGGMAAARLDPAQIGYIIVTHAHGDHHGGIAMLRNRYPNVHVVVTKRDWDFGAKPFYMPDGNLDSAPKLPQRRDGDIGWRGKFDLVVGDTTFHLLETPGHTPGTTALVYTVRHGAGRETIAQWGGGSPFDRVFSPASVQAFANLAKANHATVQWSSHTGMGFWGMSSRLSFPEKAALVSDGGAPHPFVIDQALMNRYLDTMVACKKASVLD